MIANGETILFVRPHWLLYVESTVGGLDNRGLISVMAQRLDMDTLEPAGDPSPVFRSREYARRAWGVRGSSQRCADRRAGASRPSSTRVGGWGPTRRRLGGRRPGPLDVRRVQRSAPRGYGWMGPVDA